MNKRVITQEEFENEKYPLCKRCEHYADFRSSVFGSSWGCELDHDSVLVDDNDFDMKTSGDLTIHDCGDYKEGKPKIFHLG